MIREGEPADLSRLREIQAATLAEPWPELLATAIEGPPPLFVVDEEGPVAYAIVIGDGGTAAYVPEFAVHPAHQREGYGSQLLSFLRERLAADGYERLRLTVLASDDGARAFYATHGFEPVERLDGHFTGGDGLLLGLSLDAV